MGLPLDRRTDNRIPDYARGVADRGTQKRTLDFHRVQTRAADSEPGFGGLVSRWWQVDSYGSCRPPGSFTKTITERGDEVVILCNHDARQNVGVPESLTEAEDGFRIEARLIDDDNGPAHHLIQSMRGGGRWGLSFGFEVFQFRAVDLEHDPIDLTNAPAWIRENPEYVIVQTEIGLWEVSPVTFPSDRTARVESVRSDPLLTPTLTELVALAQRGKLDELAPDQRRDLDALIDHHRRATAGPGNQPPTHRDDGIADLLRLADVDAALARL